MFNVVEFSLFRYTAVLLSLIVLTALIGIIGWSLGWVFNTFSALLLSLAVAGILALMLHPVVELLERRLHLPPLRATILVLMVFFASIGGLIFLFVPHRRQPDRLLPRNPDRTADNPAHGYLQPDGGSEATH